MYPFSKGALHRGYDAPGETPDIALEPGEPRAGSGPVATGDTLCWIVCDIENGAKTAKRVRFVVKPTRPDLMSNLIVNTDRRTYHLELRSDDKTYMASVSWTYSQDQLIALRQQNVAAEAVAPVATGVDVNALNFRYSALTWNAHRIHYDGDYTRSEEGYPALVSNGGLSMHLMIDAALRHATGALSGVTARLVHPLWVGDAIEVRGEAQTDGRLKIWTADKNGVLCGEMELEFTA